MLHLLLRRIFQPFLWILLLFIVIQAGCQPNVKPSQQPSPTAQGEVPVTPESLVSAEGKGKIANGGGFNIGGRAPETKIGFLVPLSGPYKDLGQSMLHAAQLALFDINASNLTIVTGDCKGTSVGATAAARTLLHDGAKIIFGPVFSPSARAVAPLAYEYDVNIISFSNDVSLADNSIFLMGMSPEQQVERIISYAASQGITEIAGLVPNNTFGSVTAGAIQEVAKKNSMKVTGIEYYVNKTSNMQAGVERVMETLSRSDSAKNNSSVQDGGATATVTPAQPAVTQAGTATDASTPTSEPGKKKALLIAESGKTLSLLLKWINSDTLKQQNIRILGIGSWDTEKNIEISPALVGAWFTGPDYTYLETFRKRFKDSYGYEPHPLSSLAYDAVALAASLSSSPAGEPNFSYSAITNPRGFVGINGIFRFNNNGKIERGLAVLEVTGSGVTTIDPAPKNF